MLNRILAVIGVLLALLGVIVAPGVINPRRRRTPLPIHQFNPDQGEIPWELTGWIPVGFCEKRGSCSGEEWTWMPLFRRIK